MNWGHRLKELVTRNWREKLISLVLAFLFWFMIKAQDVRHTPAYPSQSLKMPPQQTFSPPPQLTPTVQPSLDVPVKLTPALPTTPAATETPAASSGGDTAKSTGL